MDQDRRRQRRVEVGLPIRVKGVDVEGAQITKVTRSINVSPDGALFELEARLERGMLLELSLPLPKQMQKSVPARDVYEAVGLVTRVEKAAQEGGCKVAVRFRPAHVKHYRSEVTSRKQAFKVSGS